MSVYIVSNGCKLTFSPNGELDCHSFREIYTFRNSGKRNYCAINVGIEIQAMSDIKQFKDLCLQGQIKRYPWGLGHFSVFWPFQCWYTRFGELTAINNIGRTRRWTRAQLFEGWLVLDLGLNLTRFCYYFLRLFTLTVPCVLNWLPHFIYPNFSVLFFIQQTSFLFKVLGLEIFH